MNRPIVYFDMDNVLCDFLQSYTEHIHATPEIKYPQCKMDFYRKLKPITNGIDTFNLLNHYFDVYILTSPSVENPMCYTEKRLWVEDHLGMDAVNKLIISPNKALLMGDYLIDDNSSGRGQEWFTGRLIQIGSDEFPNWESIKHYFNGIRERNPLGL